MLRLALTLLLAGPPLEVLCANPDAGAADFALQLAEFDDIIDWQRRDYAVAWLLEHGSSEAKCPRLVDLATPRTFTLKEGDVTLTWSPERGDWQCFTALTVNGQTLALEHEFCLATPPRAVREDFNFDGRPDVRVVAVNSFAHSRRFDLVLLAKGGDYVVSAELSALDDLEVRAKKKVLTARVVDPETKVSRRQTYRWEKGALAPAR